MKSVALALAVLRLVYLKCCSGDGGWLGVAVGGDSGGGTASEGMCS